MSDKVRCSVCVYMPYPGTPLWPDALKRGSSRILRAPGSVSIYEREDNNYFALSDA